MPVESHTASVLLLVAVASVGCEGGGGLCDAAALTAALAAAQSGDTVRFGACRIEGAFTVPAGVTLAGTDRGQSVLLNDTSEPTVTLVPGTPPSRLQDLTVATDGVVAVMARGEGAVVAERSDIVAVRGMAFGAEGLTSLELDDLWLEGPVTAENVDTVSPLPSGQTTATHGLVLIDVADASLTHVTATGFAGFGALLVSSIVRWEGGGAPGNLTVGLMEIAGHGTLADLDFGGTFQGTGLMPAYGGLFVSGASVASERLTVDSGEGFGVLHQRATAHHADLRARGNQHAAFSAFECDAVELWGSETELSENDFANVIVVNSGGVSIRDARIDAARLVARVYRETGSIEVGDGLQLVDLSGDVVLKDLRLSGNERVQVVVEMEAGSFDALTFDNVIVEGTGEQLGAWAQGELVPENWDSGVTRLGDTITNDEYFTGRLPMVGVAMASEVPDPVAIVAAGLDGIIAGF